MTSGDGVVDCQHHTASVGGMSNVETRREEFVVLDKVREFCKSDYIGRDKGLK